MKERPLFGENALNVEFHSDPVCTDPMRNFPLRIASENLGDPLSLIYQVEPQNIKDLPCVS